MICHREVLFRPRNFQHDGIDMARVIRQRKGINIFDRNTFLLRQWLNPFRPHVSFVRCALFITYSMVRLWMAKVPTRASSIPLALSVSIARFRSLCCCWLHLARATTACVRRADTNVFRISTADFDSIKFAADEKCLRRIARGQCEPNLLQRTSTECVRNSYGSTSLPLSLARYRRCTFLIRHRSKRTPQINAENCQTESKFCSPRKWVERIKSLRGELCVIPHLNLTPSTTLFPFFFVIFLFRFWHRKSRNLINDPDDVRRAAAFGYISMVAANGGQNIWAPKRLLFLALLDGHQGQPIIVYLK